MLRYVRKHVLSVVHGFYWVSHIEYLAIRPSMTYALFYFLVLTSFCKGALELRSMQKLGFGLK